MSWISVLAIYFVIWWLVLFTVLHPSVRRKRAEAVEAALDRPASEQIDPSRPERANERRRGDADGATGEGGTVVASGASVADDAENV